MLAQNNSNGDVVIDIGDYNEVILTHLHADHCGGIEELAYDHIFRTGKRCRLYSKHSILDNLWGHSLYSLHESSRSPEDIPQMDWFFHPVPFDTTLDIGGGLKLFSRIARHNTETISIKLDYKSHRIGYSADTAFDHDLIDWLSDCDLIIHEVFTLPDVDHEISAIHTLPEALLSIPIEIQEKTLLVHYGDNWRDLEPLGQFRFMRQSRRYTVGSHDKK